MKHTKHFQKRINSRGIIKSHIEFTLEHGDVHGDKMITNRKNVKSLLEKIKFRITKLRCLKRKFGHFAVSSLIAKKLAKLEQDKAVALKVLDKGGVTVVCAGGNFITAYDTDSYFSY